MALTRADVDLDAATVRVVRSVAEVDGGLVIRGPKSAAGRRVVAHAPVVDVHRTGSTPPADYARLSVTYRRRAPSWQRRTDSGRRSD